MPDPVNYMALIPQPDLGQSLAQGFAFGNAIRNRALQDEERRMQMEAMQAEQARQQQVAGLREKALTTRDTSDFAAWISLDPKNMEAIDTAFKMMGTEQRNNEFNQAARVYSSIQNGDTGTALKLISSQITAMKNSGEDTTELELLHQNIFNHPERAAANVGTLLSVIDPDKFKKMQDSLAAEQKTTTEKSQRFERLVGGQAFNMIKNGDIPGGYGMLQSKIEAGKRQGLDVTALESMRDSISANWDKSAESADAVMNVIEPQWQAIKTGKLEERKAGVDIDTKVQALKISKQYGELQAQAELDAKAAETAAQQALADQREQQNAINAELGPQIAEADLRMKNAQIVAQEQTNELQNRYAGERMRLDNAVAQADLIRKERDNAIDEKYKDETARLNQNVLRAQSENAEAYQKALTELKQHEATIAGEKAANAPDYEQAVALRAKFEADLANQVTKYYAPVEQAKLEHQILTNEQLKRTNDINAKTQERLEESKTRKAEADAVISEAQAQVAGEAEKLKLKESERAYEEKKRNEAIELKQKAATLGLTEQQIVQSMVTAKKTNAEIAKINMELQAMKNNPSGITPKDRFDQEEKLRKEYTSRNATFSAVEQAYSSVKSAANSPNAAGVADLAMINGYQRMIDPGGIVREGDVSLLQQTAGKWEYLKNLAAKWTEGQMLTPKQRADILEISGRINAAAQKQKANNKAGISRVADSYGLDKKNIFSPEETGSNATSSTATQYKPGSPVQGNKQINAGY